MRILDRLTSSWLVASRPAIAARSSHVALDLSATSIREASERLRLMRLAPKIMKRIAEPEVKEIVETIMPMSVEDAAKCVRTNLADVEKRFAS